MGCGMLATADRPGAHFARTVAVGRWFAIFLFGIVCVPARAQTDSALLLDQLAGLVDRGTLNLSVDMKAGSATLVPGWSLQTFGTPNAAVTIATPPGMTEAWDVAGKRNELSDALQASTGPSGTKTWTLNSVREFAGWLVALRPA